MSGKITQCQTVAELTVLENLYVLNEHDKELAFQRKVEIVCRIVIWGMENEPLLLVAGLADTWTPKQRKQFVYDWQDDESLLEIGR